MSKAKQVLEIRLSAKKHLRDEKVFYYAAEILYLFILFQTDMPFYKERQKLQNYKVSNTGVIWDSMPKYGWRDYQWGKKYFNILTSDNHKEPNVMEYIVKYNNAH